MLAVVKGSCMSGILFTDLTVRRYITNWTECKE